MTTTEQATTHQLDAGNIVLAHGMRILLGQRAERTTDCGAAGKRLVVSFDSKTPPPTRCGLLRLQTQRLRGLIRLVLGCMPSTFLTRYAANPHFLAG